MSTPAPTLRQWVSDKGDKQRVYVNNLRGVVWAEAAWSAQCGYMVHGPQHTTPEVIAEARDLLLARFHQWKPLWDAAGRKETLGPVDAPKGPTLPDMIQHLAVDSARETVKQALIIHLVPAARMAGIKFRNGVSKDELIQRVLSAGDATIIATATAIAQLRAGLKAPEPHKLTPQDIPKQNIDDWLDPDEKPAPAPEGPKAALGQAQPQVDLSAYVKKPELAEVDIRASEAIRELRAALKVIQDARPVEIRFPEKPEPVKLEGLQHPQFLDLLLSLRAGLHCMLVGPAGSGKTYSAEQAAKALDRHFYMQGAISYAHELLGYVDAHSRYVRTQFRDAFEKGGLILLDEFDASAAEAALVLNAALANGACAFPDGLIRKHADFLCIIGANTDGSGATMQYSGRARLDGAFLDRFVVFDWQIDPRIEKMLAQGNEAWLAAVLAIRQFAHSRQILDVVATPRATQRGALLASQGMDRTRILERTCKRGALTEAWAEVMRLPAVATFLRG